MYMVDCLLPLMRCGLQTEIETPTSILEMQIADDLHVPAHKLATLKRLPFSHSLEHGTPPHKNNPSKYVFSRMVKSALLEMLNV
jgi:hypothetical protein